MLPPAAVTNRESGMQVQYSAPFTVYSIGSQVVLDDQSNCLNMVYKKLCSYGTCKSDNR